MKKLSVVFGLIFGVLAFATPVSADLLPPTPTRINGCYDSGYYYQDGSIISCINSTYKVRSCPVDSYYVCRNGRWIMNNAWRNQNYNRPPVITSFSGPTTLRINQSGTWTIRANDPENGNLTYDIDWGDEPVYRILSDNVASGSSFTQRTTFQHSYSQAGTYTVTITVRDNAGKTTTSTATVRVGENNYWYPQPYNPNPWWNYYYNYDNYYNYYDYNNYQ